MNNSTTEKEIQTYLKEDSNFQKILIKHMNNNILNIDGKGMIYGAQVLNTDKNTQKDKIIECIMSNKPIPMEYFYNSDIGALRWKELCNDNEYKSLKKSKSFIEKNYKKIFEKTGKDMILNQHDIVSIGPGDGSKDAIFLQKLNKYIILNNKINTLGIYYIAIDVSTKLLSLSLDEILSKSEIKSNFNIRYINTNFEKMMTARAMLRFNKRPKIFLCLGNTFGNTSSEQDFLENIIRLMEKDDILILEVRMINQMDHSILDADGSEEKGTDFNLTPLEIANLNFSTKNNPIEPTSKKVAKSQINNTKSETIICKNLTINNKTKNVTLSLINYYDLNSLKKVLNDNFKILSPDKNFNQEGFFILKLVK